MLRMMSFLSVLTAPAVAMAHPGHEHVGSALQHHTLEQAGFVLAAVAGLWLVSRLARRANAS